MLVFLLLFLLRDMIILCSLSSILLVLRFVLLFARIHFVIQPILLINQKK